MRRVARQRRVTRAVWLVVLASLAAALSTGCAAWLTDLPQEGSDALASARLALRAAEELEADGAPERARQVLEQAATRCRAAGDARCEAEVLNGLGRCLRDLGEMPLALESHEEALRISRTVGDRTEQAASLDGIGAVFRDLGETGRALENHQEAVQISRLIRNAAGEGAASAGLGAVYRNLGRRQDALAHFRIALARFLEADHREDSSLAAAGPALTRIEIGAVLREMGAPREALGHLELALRDFQARRNRRGEASALYSLGAAHSDLGEDSTAVAYEQVALTLFRSTRNRAGEAKVAAVLARLLSRSAPERAIFHGKQAVSRYETLREDIRGLAPALQQSYAESVAGAYRALASLLAERARVPEAQEVLGLLKSREFYDFTRRDASRPREDDVPYTPAEERERSRYEDLSERLTAVVGQLAALRQSLPGYKDAAKEEVLIETERAARRELRTFFQGLQGELGGGRARQGTVPLPAAADLARALQVLGPGHVAVYTLVAGDAVRLIVSSAERRTSYVSPLGARELAAAVLDLREALTDVRSDPRAPARKLYDAIVAPVAGDLDEVGAHTVIWSLDGVLRYVPMGALFDGEHWLAERYRSVIFPGGRASALAVGPAHRWTALGLGVTRAHEGLPALPGVRAELEAIVTTGAGPGILPGQVLLDEAFSRDALGSARESGNSVVHVASHFLFRPGDETRSFLLLGDGSHLTLGEMRAMAFLFRGIDQVTLSACNSATQGGEGAEIDGLAMVAQEKGAAAVLASLWPVADVSTPALMREYYARREAGAPRPEALQAAQVAMIRGTLGPAGEREPGWRHPFFWAPFILLGSAR